MSEHEKHDVKEKDAEVLEDEKKDAKKYMDMKNKSDRLDFAFLAAAIILFAGGIDLVRQTQALTGPTQILYAIGTLLVVSFSAYFAHIYVKLMKD